MSETITVFLKPTCSKCRELSKLLSQRGISFEAVNYYEKPFTPELLHAVLKKAGLTPREVLRKDEPIARTLGVGRQELTDSELIKLMVQNPDLIQRPIVVKGKKAVLARPIENLEKLDL